MYSIFFDDEPQVTQEEYPEDIFWSEGEFISPKDAPSSQKKKRDPDGCFCVKCKEFFPYAEPNQTNGTMKCWSCRNF